MILIIKHVSSEGPGLIGGLFYKHHYDIKTIDLEHGDKLPKNINGIDAVISMGGPMNVYEETRYPFLKEEDALLRLAFKARVPVLGICLGAQLMAKALGAKIDKSSEKEIGWDKVPLTCHGIIDPLFEGLDNILEVFQWHEDKFEVPKNTVLLAENEVCAQAFKVNDNSYAFQFHIEVTTNMIKQWLNNTTIKINEQEIISRAYAIKDRFTNQMSNMLENYLKIIRLYENSPSTN